MADIGAATEMLLVLKGCLFLVLATVVHGVGNSEHAAAGNINIRHGGRKLGEIPAGFISIACGSSKDYIDNRGIPYVTDKGFTDTGEAHETETLQNLRSFPQGKRNCYSLKPDQGKNNKFLIRATFLYGNYDGKNQAPVFDLYLGVNKWITVNTLHMMRNVKQEYEIFHLLSTDYIDVCLVNTNQGVPIITALEVRRMDNSIYRIPASGALHMRDRRDVGSTTESLMVSYPNDVYDRHWYTDQQDNWTRVSSDSTIYTHSTDNAYELPAQVLKTASKTRNASIPLQVSWNWPALDTLSKYYVYFHFAEIEKLEPGQQRALTIDLNGERNLAESVKLDYLNPLTIAQDDPPISGGGTLYFSIKAAQGTTIPPILNAYEIFVVP